MKVLAFDTAGSCVALCLADVADGRITECLSLDGPAPRKANQVLLDRIDELLSSAHVRVTEVDALVVGTGPGSFTGVRIGVASAKGLSLGLGVALYGVSTLDAYAWKARRYGIRGRLGVIADAMRKEVYPLRFEVSDGGVECLGSDCVACPQDVAKRWRESEDDIMLVGDGLRKYAALFEGDPYRIGAEELWEPDGRGLVEAFLHDQRNGSLKDGDAAYVLPLYTRLSDAEENERRQLVEEEAGVVPSTGVADRRARDGLVLHPLSINDVDEVVALQEEAMGEDAWTTGKLADEIGRADRTWWVARIDGYLAGCAGGQVVDGELCLFSVCVAEGHRRGKVATRMIERVAADGRALGARTITLEVRVGNDGAIAFYRALGLSEVGVRPRYYKGREDAGREDALIMQGDLPLAALVPMRDGSDDTENSQVDRRGAGEENILRRGALSVCPSAEEGRQVDRRGALKVPPYETRTNAPAADAASASRCNFCPPLILAIESSCDETAASVIDAHRNVVAESVASQVDFHARFGGVVPEIASRKHIEAIVPTVLCAMSKAGLSFDDLSAVAVTQGPGLVGALVVGLSFAKGLAFACDLPLICVNHLEGHLYANRLVAPDIEPPFVALLVSGGHTMLVDVRAWGDYEVIGSTLDDAVGEAFDKVAKALGLGYPGGPILSRLAENGDPKAIDFPRAMLNSGDYRFSLSGLKTAVVTYIHRQNEMGAPVNVPNLAASFQAAVVDVLVAKSLAACKELGVETFCIGGGVASNECLRTSLAEALGFYGIRVILPDPAECTDNASMIAAAAIDHYANGCFAGLDADPVARLAL